MKKTKTRKIEAAADALRRIREVGYNSQAHRATDSVLGIVRIAEEALAYIEKKGKHAKKTIDRN